MKKNAPKPSWRPAYPEPKDRQVEMVDCTIQTYISDQRAVITISDHPFEDPACFWIDPSHIYARINWRQWCAVEPSNPNVAAALCASHHCQMSQFVGNALKDMSAPVYHIAELPPELFAWLSERDSFKKSFVARKHEAVSSLADSIPPSVDAISFRHVELDGSRADLVVSSDDIAVVFAVYPEDADCSACPPGTKPESPVQAGLEIPATVLDDLGRHRASLAKMEPHAKVFLAIIASSKTLESMRRHWGDELAERDIELVEYNEYESFLMKHCPLLD